MTPKDILSRRHAGGYEDPERHHGRGRDGLRRLPRRTGQNRSSGPRRNLRRMPRGRAKEKIPGMARLHQGSDRGLEAALRDAGKRPSQTSRNPSASAVRIRPDGLEQDGSLGIHNHAFMEDVLTKALKKIKSLGTPSNNEQTDLRQRFLGGSLLATVASFLYPVIRYILPPQPGRGRPEKSGGGQGRRPGPEHSQDLQVRAHRPAILINTQDGQLLAFSAVCTHLTCTVTLRGRHGDAVLSLP